jgi:hypothetical protein
LWWPLEVPDPRRPLAAPAHAHFAAHAAVGFLAGELLARRGPVPSAGRARAAERAISVVATFAIWAIFTGAWDRRANGRS